MLPRVVRFFTESWGLKLAAVALAILAWMAVRAGAPEQATFRNRPVEVDLRDPGWRLKGDPEPPVVNVTVRGSTAELMDLTSSPPRIVLPVEQVNDTTEVRVVPLQWVQFPPGLSLGEARVVELRPDTIRLHYQRLDARMLPVRVRTRGELPEGLSLALPINTNPGAVEVRGPPEALVGLDSVPLAPVNLSGIRATTNVPAAVDSTALGDVVVEPREVNVILRVVPADSLPGPTGDSASRPSS